MASPYSDKSPSIDQSEHISPAKTGDNIEAKKVAGYVWNPAAGVAGEWERQPAGSALVPSSYDYIGFTNPDANGNYQTITYKSGGSGGTTTNTLSLVFDGANNITSVTRT
jgi:hypothetical protein